MYVYAGMKTKVTGIVDDGESYILECDHGDRNWPITAFMKPFCRSNADKIRSMSWNGYSRIR